MEHGYACPTNYDHLSMEHCNHEGLQKEPDINICSVTLALNQAFVMCLFDKSWSVKVKNGWSIVVHDNGQYAMSSRHFVSTWLHIGNLAPPLAVGPPLRGAARTTEMLGSGWTDRGRGWHVRFCARLFSANHPDGCSLEISESHQRCALRAPHIFAGKPASSFPVIAASEKLLIKWLIIVVYDIFSAFFFFSENCWNDHNFSQKSNHSPGRGTLRIHSKPKAEAVHGQQLGIDDFAHLPDHDMESMSHGIS